MRTALTLSSLFLLAVTALWPTQQLNAQRTDRLLAFTIYDSPPPQDNPLFHTIYTGMALSTNGGESWSSAGWVTNRSNGIAQDPADASTLYLATDYGLLKSEDAGRNWKLSTPWDITDVLCVAAAPAAIWIGTARGVYVSTDRGVSWTARNHGLPTLNGHYTADLLADGDTLLISTADGIHISGDRGISWSPAGLQGLGIDRLIRRQRTLLALTSEGAIRISTDFGASWSGHPATLRSNSVQCLALDQGNPAEILAGTRDLGVLRSTDFGASWTNQSGGLTNLNVTAIARDPDNPDVIYIGTENGSFISRNNAASWESFTVRMGFISSITMLEANP